MKASLIIPLLALSACISMGCGGSPTTSIPAAAPGDRFGQSNKVPQAGDYVLYRVTQTDEWGAPINAQKVTTVNLKANEVVGFDYLWPKDNFYYPDSHSELVAYAGASRFNLGPITSMNEKYYWAIPGEWDGFWAQRPERMLTRRLMMY